MSSISVLTDGEQATELGQILFNLVSVVPKGMVVFLPSYSFFNAVKEVWETSGLMSKLAIKKKVQTIYLYRLVVIN